MPIYRRHPSRAGEWISGRVQPARLAIEADLEVWLALPSESDEDQIWEALSSRILDSNHAEIRGVPALAYGVRFGDTVAVTRSGEGSLVVTGIAERSSFTTFRIWLGSDVDTSVTWESIADTYAQLGCLIDVFSEKLVAIASPAEAVVAVRASLASGSRVSGFEWEESS